MSTDPIVWPDDAFEDAPPEPEWDDDPDEYASAFLGVCPAGGPHVWTDEGGHIHCDHCGIPDTDLHHLRGGEK